MHRRGGHGFPMSLAAMVGLLILCGTALVARGQEEARPVNAGAKRGDQNAAPADASKDIAVGDAAFQKQDWAAAVAAYQAALSKGATQRIVHFRLGYALHALKRYEEALMHHLIAAQIAHKALRIDALYNAACAHALLGRKEPALKFLTYAIDAGFVDLTQVGKDTDLDSLREDAEFKRLIGGIGKTPRLAQQMDFFLGSWTRTNGAGEVTQEMTLARPLPDSAAILTTATNAGFGSWTGLMTPDHAERTWAWTKADGIGTTMTLTGKALDGGGVRFEGRDSFAGGKGVLVRITFTPRADGSVTERADISEDGTNWRTHHEEIFRKSTAEKPDAK